MSEKHADPCCDSPHLVDITEVGDERGRWHCVECGRVVQGDTLASWGVISATVMLSGVRSDYEIGEAYLTDDPGELGWYRCTGVTNARLGRWDECTFVDFIRVKPPAT